MKFTLFFLALAAIMAWLTGCTPAYHAENLSPVTQIVRDAKLQRLKDDCEYCQRDSDQCLIGDDIDCAKEFGGKK
jgi:hypothetical protein